jgi:hypothetical protein
VFLVSAPWYLRMLSVTCYVRQRENVWQVSYWTRNCKPVKWVVFVMLIQSKCVDTVKWQSLTIDGVWLDDRIYWDSLIQRVSTLYRSLLHTRARAHAHTHTHTHAHAHAHAHTHTSVHIHIFTAVVWQRFPTADVPIPLGSKTALGLSFQLLPATAHNYWTPAVR